MPSNRLAQETHPKGGAGTKIARGVDQIMRRFIATRRTFACDTCVHNIGTQCSVDEFIHCHIPGQLKSRCTDKQVLCDDYMPSQLAAH